MNVEEIKKKISVFLLEKIPNQGLELKDDTDLLNEWFLDSLGIINTIMFLEGQFSINVARSEINGDNFTNLNTLSEYIISKSK